MPKRKQAAKIAANRTGRMGPGSVRADSADARDGWREELKGAAPLAYSQRQTRPSLRWSSNTGNGAGNSNGFDHNLSGKPDGQTDWQRSMFHRPAGKCDRPQPATYVVRRRRNHTIPISRIPVRTRVGPVAAGTA